MTSDRDPRENLLLAALPPAELQRLAPLIESVELPAGELLRLSGNTMRHVYFPTTAVVSLQQNLECGSTAEIAVIGNEGVVGLSALAGAESTPSCAVVQCAGHAFRFDTQVIKDEFQRSGPATRLLLLYTQAVITLTAQTAVCNRFHSLQQRLCRRLLQGLDRTQGDELTLTHECIATALGVRREGVTTAARDLREAGVIRYTRGRITVLDRTGLHGRTCECYGVVKNEYERLLGPTAPAMSTCPSRMRPAVNLLPRKAPRPASAPHAVVA
jgi:CRP-like cAMP-binding protein